MKDDTPQKMSKAVRTEIDGFNQWKGEIETLEARLQSSSARLGELRIELSQLEHEKENAAKSRRKTADKLATGEIGEREFTEIRRKYAELSEQIDATADLKEAFERAVGELQRKLNDARAHAAIARRKTCGAYCGQIQTEIKELCGGLILTGLAAKHAGGSQSGRDAMGYFLAGVLTGNENLQPEHETFLQIKNEIEQKLGIGDE